MNITRDKNWTLVLLSIALLSQSCSNQVAGDIPSGFSFELNLKSAGNPAYAYELVPAKESGAFLLQDDDPVPIEIVAKISHISPEISRITVSVKANEAVNFHLRGKLSLPNIEDQNASYLLPGFWYRKNLRSPEGTPSARLASDWMVREDRLSIPLTGVYDNIRGQAVSICRLDDISLDALMPYKKGEVIIYGKTDIGALGFKVDEGKVALSFSYPFSEEPASYIRKLTLAPSVVAFQHMEAGEKKVLTWEVRIVTAKDYSQFVEKTWNYAYDLFKPELLEERRSDEALKSVLTQFFYQSFTDTYKLKGFSGVHLNIDSCENRGLLEVGFVGRVLLNAYNAVEYGYAHEDVGLLTMGHQVFESYNDYGFTEQGFIREVVDDPNHYETEVFSIRRQSEGLYAILQFLKLENLHHRKHPELSEKARKLLDNIVMLQRGESFPRKFNEKMEIIDTAGGSSSTAIIPLLMAWKYYDYPVYLEAAKKAALYLEKEIISKGDYFSSTLDANCEDKEASIYASCAMYYLALLSEGKESQHYYELAEKAAYFALSWYYLWDVPFAPGQMLGDLEFKTRGWGNVSVENNHVDVYIFDFADVLKHLSMINGNKRLAEMAAVIKSSMRDQLLPEEGRMCGIGKIAYHPEVVQHTNWDYGHFGKGYYNDLFAPGWVVSSLWELLSEDRLHNYFMN